MNRYKFFWRNGYIEEGNGYTAVDAFKALGHNPWNCRKILYYEKVE